MSNQQRVLEKYVALRKRVVSFQETTEGYKGRIDSVTETDLSHIEILRDYFIDIFTEGKNISDFDNLSTYQDQTIFIELRSDDLNYYEKFQSFLRGNKLREVHTPYYINECDFFHGQQNHPEIVKKYKINLSLIDLLKDVSDYKKQTGNNSLELFFYKSDNGTTLAIDYNEHDLERMTGLSKVQELKEHFNQKADKEERKQIFKNELINFLGKEGGKYSAIISQWDVLIDNYQKSFELYLTGFSFERIKTASIEHFHNLSNKINDTISKVSNYIFAVPIAFIFLIKQLDFSGQSFGNDTLMLLLGILFFLLVWLVPFKNISESIKSIEQDIENYQEKLKGEKTLITINEKLETLKTKNLKSQKRKLQIVRTISILILLTVIFSYFYIHYILMFCS